MVGNIHVYIESVKTLYNRFDFEIGYGLIPKEKFFKQLC